MRNIPIPSELIIVNNFVRKMKTIINSDYFKYRLLLVQFFHIF
jgi:hypothetical protein